MKTINLFRLALLFLFLAAALQTHAQNVGVDVASPQQKLDVLGGIRIGNTTVGLAGSMRWTGTQFEGHDGSVWAPFGSAGTSWSLTGNSGTTPGTNFIGTTDAQDFVIKRFNDEGLRLATGGALWASGNITTGVTPTSGAGTRMMWIPNKNAFRAGIVTGTQWDNGSVGRSSVAFGEDNIASGAESFASGRQNTASGAGAVASGWTNLASGTLSAAIGGQQNTASGYASLALNGNTTASGQYALSANQQNTASGKNSAVFGLLNTAPSFAEMVVGVYATNYSAVGTTAIDPSDRVFNVGNGTSSGARSDAFTVLKSGNVGIGTAAPSQRLEVQVSNNGLNFPLMLRNSNNTVAGNAVGIGFVNETSGSWPKAGIVHERNNSWARGKMHFLLNNSADATPAALTDAKMTITAGGNVGIGTTIPLQVLDVNGKIQMQSGATVGYVPVSDANGTMTWTNPTSLTITETDPQVSSATTNRIPKWNGTALIDGIVTDNGSNVVVSGGAIIDNGASSVITISGDRNGGNTPYNTVNTTAPARIDFQNNDIGNANTDYLAGRIESVNRPGVNDGELRFYTAQNLVLQEAMNINNVGNVGIGTIASDKLHVVGSIRMVDGNQTAGYIPVSDANGKMTWTNPATITTAYVDEIRDADNDTKIQVEESADEDIIRFDAAGTQLYSMRKTAGGSPWLEVNSSNTLIGSTISTGINGSGAYNTAVGFQAAQNLTTGQKNTYYGDNAGGSNTTGSNNTMIGTVAGQFNNGGNANTIVGGNAGRNNLTGSGNVFLGFGAGENETTSNKLYIDNSNTTAPLIYGDFSNNELNVNGQLGIGITSPNAYVDITGTNAGTNSLQLRSGNTSSGNSSNQVVFGFNGAESYRHAIQTRHNSGADANNAIDFYIWDNGTDAVGDIGTKRVLTIDGNGATGSVGIGTSSPAEELHVVGNIRMVDGNQAANKVMVSDANGTGTWTNATSLTITETDPQVSSATTNQIPKWNGTTLTDGIVTDNGTNIGIGSTSPTARLDVIGTARATDVMANGTSGNLMLSNSNTSATDYFRIDGNADKLYVIAESGTSGNVTGTEIRFRTAATNATAVDRVTINNNGNVGIGTSLPVNMLDVEGSIAVGATYSGSNTAPANGAIIEGNVGIATTNPQDKLHVVGNIRMIDGNQATGKVMVSDANGTASWTNAPSINILRDTDNDTKIQVEESADEDKIRFDMAGTEYFVMTNGRLNVVNTGGSTFLGQDAGLADDLSNNFNTFAGYFSGKANTTGSDNVAYGAGSLENNVSGSNNTAIGRLAMLNRTSGGSNTALGQQALYGNISGSNNTAVGTAAGQNNTGSGNVFIGYAAGYNEAGSDKLYIDNSTTASPLIYGDFSTDEVTVNGELGIGITSPAYDIDVYKTEVNVNQRIYSNDALGIGHLLTGANGGGHINLVANSSAATYLGIPAGLSGLVTDYGDMVFATGTSNSGTEQMRITTSGSVGIGTGTATPGAPLHVSVNNATSQVLITPSSTTGQDAAVTIRGARNGSTTSNQAQLKFENYDIDIPASYTMGTIVGKVTHSGSNTGDLVFNNSTDGTTLSETMRLTSGGMVGIGSPSPTQAKLVVNGSQNSNPGAYGYLNNSAPTGTNAAGTNAYSIYASARIAATEFNAYSDLRIKNIKGISNSSNDLKMLMDIEITDYTFIDKVEKGNSNQKKVIAQQVEKIYPQAVSTITDVVPDIYKIAEINSGRITVANNLKAGEKVKLIFENKTELVEVASADETGFNVNLPDNGKVFVFGREVNDFRTVDYEALSTLNISATQELVKMINQLQNENSDMQNKFYSLSSDVEILKTMLNVGTKAEK